MADIFISYAREDRSKVEKLAGALEAEGYSVWWDRRIQSGAEFSKDIEKELHAAKAVLVAWSEMANDSRWVKDEANAAAEERKLLAISLHGDKPPMGFRQYHYVNFAGWNGSAEAPAYRELADAIRARLTGETPDYAPAQTGSPLKDVLSKPGAMAAIAAVVIGVMALALMLVRGQEPSPEAIAQSDAAPAAEAALQEAEKISIAVLPFVALSSNVDDGFFADGLTEEILNKLTALPDLDVTARTSSFYFKGKNIPVDEIAERLGVRHILEGSVRPGGGRMRITAQLIRASDGFHLWSNSYDATEDDVIQVQTDIAVKVATALDILLNDERRALMEAAGVNNPDAFALFAKGEALYRKAHGGAPQIATLMQANEIFDQAADLAPDLWVANYYSSDLYTHAMLRLANGQDPARLPEDVVQNARAEHARRLDAAMRHAPTEAARAFIDHTARIFSDDWTGLAADTRRLFTYTQSCGYDQWTHLVGAVYGDAALARAFYLRGAACNSIGEAYWLHASYAALYEQDYQGALDIIDRGMAIAETTLNSEEHRIRALAALKRFDEARAALSRLDSNRTDRLESEVFLAAAQGDRKLADELRNEYAGFSNVSDFEALRLAAWAGDAAAANEIAARIDARPAGPTLLTQSVAFCLCGAPFDIGKTPNFKQRIEESGLVWPPDKPIDLPLKYW